MFKIKAVYYLELLPPETMGLLGSPKSKITNSENVSHSEITEVILSHCSILILSIIIISKVKDSYIHLFLIYCLVNYEVFHRKILYF